MSPIRTLGIGATTTIIIPDGIILGIGEVDGALITDPTGTTHGTTLGMVGITTLGATTHGTITDGAMDTTTTTITTTIITQIITTIIPTTTGLVQITIGAMYITGEENLLS